MSSRLPPTLRLLLPTPASREAVRLPARAPSVGGSQRPEALPIGDGLGHSSRSASPSSSAQSSQTTSINSHARWTTSPVPARQVEQSFVRRQGHAKHLHLSRESLSPQYDASVSPRIGLVVFVMSTLAAMTGCGTTTHSTPTSSSSPSGTASAPSSASMIALSGALQDTVTATSGPVCLSTHGGNSPVNGASESDWSLNHPG